MADTVDSIVKRTFRRLGVLGVADTSLPPEMLTEGINHLNDLTDSLNLDRGFIYVIEQKSFDLVASQKEYTIGNTGAEDWTATRPLRVLKATITKDSHDYRMRCISYDEWMDIYNKTDESQIPRWLYYESNYPLGKIYINYVPSEVNTINLALEKQLDEFAAGALWATPQGYKKALIDLLAFDLWDLYPSEAHYETIKRGANKALSRIKKLNFKNLMIPAELDSRVLPQGRRGRGRSLFYA